MKRLASKVVGVLFFLLGLAAQQASAHGTHIWFLSPDQNAAVQESVTFEVEAPYAKNQYIHLSVTKEGETKPRWEGLVELRDKQYSVRVDVRDWLKGRYRAEVILLGALVQHPISRDFVIGAAAHSRSGQ